MKLSRLSWALLLPLTMLACSSDRTGPSATPPPTDGGASFPDGGDAGTRLPDGAAISPDGSSDGGGAPGSHDASGPLDGSPFDAQAVDGGPDGYVAPPDASLPTTCPRSFTLPDKGYKTVLLETDENSWSTGIPMTKSGAGMWEVTTPVPYGKDVEYKFVADGTWLVNAAAPTVQLPSTGGVNTNNIAIGTTCGVAAPGTLWLVGGAVTTSPSSYSFQVQFTPGGAPLDPSRTVISVNGAHVSAGGFAYDPSTQLFTVSVSSGITAPNKYGYLFQVADTNGASATLFVPFWIEESAFSWNDSFMYEIMIDRFLAGGTSKAGPNGPPTDPVGDWKGGDFGGVTQKINEGYFSAMGVNTLWLSSPVLGTKLCEIGAGGNAGHCLSGYHSYFPLASGWTYGSENDPLFTSNGVTNPIDPHFGEASDLVALVNAAHAHGIRVLTDLVVNHVFSDPSPPSGQTPELAPLAVKHGNELAWFNIPYSSGVNDCGAENLWDTAETAIWNRADCWFDSYLPDFNTTNPSVDDELSNHAVWLMEQFNLDGFRVDAVKQVNNAVCVDLRSKVTSAIATDLPFYMVGEALGGVVSNVMDCVGPKMLNGSMDDPMHNTIVAAVLQTDSNAGTDLDNGILYDEATWTGAVPGALMGHFFGSHDTPRAISLAAGRDVGNPWTNAPPAQESSASAFSHLQLAQAVLLTYGAIPVLWMGDEFGQPGAIDPDCRRMMRFGSELGSNESATLTNFQKLGLARAHHSALRRGSRTRLWVDGSFYAYGRVDGSDIAVAAFNFSGGATSRTMSVTSIGLTGTVTDALSGATATVSGGNLTISLPALTAAVFTR